MRETDFPSVLTTLSLSESFITVKSEDSEEKAAIFARFGVGISDVLDLLRYLFPILPPPYINRCPFIVVRDGEGRRPVLKELTMTRTTTISVSYDEKRRLDEAAEELCGTTEVPYGEVISQLVEKATDV